MEAFLAGSVPDLQMRVFPIHQYLFLLEVDAESTDVGFVEFVTDEPTDQRSLADPRIADHQDLDFLLL